MSFFYAMFPYVFKEIDPNIKTLTVHYNAVDNFGQLFKVFVVKKKKSKIILYSVKGKSDLKMKTTYFSPSGFTFSVVKRVTPFLFF